MVQPIEKGMIDMINQQDGLYHVNLQGLEKGEVINSYRMIDVISRCLNPYKEYASYLALAEQPDIRLSSLIRQRLALRSIRLAGWKILLRLLIRPN